MQASPSSSSSLFGMHHQCVAPLAANNPHSGLSRAISIASSKVRLCRDRSFFRVAIQEEWGRPTGLLQSLWGTAVRILLASPGASKNKQIGNVDYTVIIVHSHTWPACRVVGCYAIAFNHRLVIVTRHPLLSEWYRYWAAQPMKVSADILYYQYPYPNTNIIRTLLMMLFV